MALILSLGRLAQVFTATVQTVEVTMVCQYPITNTENEPMEVDTHLASRSA
jgi:hypothetical protein